MARFHGQNPHALGEGQENVEIFTTRLTRVGGRVVRMETIARLDRFQAHSIGEISCSCHWCQTQPATSAPSLLAWTRCRSSRIICRRSVAASILVALSSWFAAGVEAGYVDPVYGVAVTSNLVYGQANVTDTKNTETASDDQVVPVDLKLDLYQPTARAGSVPSSPRPLVLLIHGGGFVSGSKTDQGISSWATLLAWHGYSVASIDYRLIKTNMLPVTTPIFFANDATLPGYEAKASYGINTAATDAVTALTYLNSHAGTLGLDTSRVFVGGGSAGAATSLFLGFGGNEPTNLNPLNNPVQIDGVLELWGSLGPLTQDFMDAGESALFVVHGDSDDTVPYADAQALDAEAAAEGLRHEFATLVGGEHAAWNAFLGDANLASLQNFQNGIDTRVPSAGSPFDRTILFMDEVIAVPEPSTMILACFAMAGLMFSLLQKRGRE